ncbi:rab-like protein 6, partial [Ixodes scapularis]
MVQENFLMTFDYVQRELPKVPDNIPVLVLANHLDMKHHRNITEDQVRFYVESIERPAGSAQIRYAESSLRNGFGLKFLYKWFNLPFLQLQRESLLLQLERNAHETDATNEELDILQESEEQNYDLFAEALNNRRREIADQLSSVSKFAEAASPQMVVNGMPSSATTVNLASETKPSGPRSAPPPRSVSVPSSLGAQEAKKQAATRAQAPTTPAATTASPVVAPQQAGGVVRSLSPTDEKAAKSGAASPTGTT